MLLYEDARIRMENKRRAEAEKEAEQPEVVTMWCSSTLSSPAD